MTGGILSSKLAPCAGKRTASNGEYSGCKEKEIQNQSIEIYHVEAVDR
jgi:hypothetical protein